MSFVTEYVETYEDVYYQRCDARLIVPEDGDRWIYQPGWGIELILGSEYQCAPIGYTVARALVFSGEAGLAWDAVDVCRECKSGNYRRLTVIRRFEGALAYLKDNPGVMRRPYRWVDDELEADKVAPYVDDMTEKAFPKDSESPQKTRRYVITERAVALMEIEVILAGLRSSDVDIATMAWIPPWHCPGCMPQYDQ